MKFYAVEVLTKKGKPYKTRKFLNCVSGRSKYPCTGSKGLAETTAILCMDKTHIITLQEVDNA